MSSTTGSIHRVKATLRDTKPPVWRRLEVPSDMSLAAFHEVLQTAFDWWNYHLHEFRNKLEVYGVPGAEDFGPEPQSDETQYTIATLLPKVKSTAVYTYDFGDDWQHDLVLEAIVEPEPEAAYPRCTAGKRRGPPEDCGGPWGFQEYLEAIADPAHPEHESMMEWRGPFDGAAFDAAEVNQRLAAQKVSANKAAARKAARKKTASKKAKA